LNKQGQIFVLGSRVRISRTPQNVISKDSEKKKKKEGKPCQNHGLVSPASNQNQNQLETMNVVWFGFSKPRFWFLDLKPNQAHH
jgi:hypothetical protein